MYNIWIKLWLLSAFADPTSKDTTKDTTVTLWSDAQVTQLELPSLTGEIESTRSQVLAKKLYFQGKESVQRAFWNLETSTLFTESSINLLKLGLLNQHQQRLSLFSESFPFEDPAGEVASQYVRAHTTLWQLENERDALDLRFIEALLTEVEKYPSLTIDFESTKEHLRLSIEQAVDDATKKEEVSELVLEHQSLVDLQSVFIQHWTLHNSVLEDYVQDILKQDETVGVLSDALLKSRYDRYTIIRSQLSAESKFSKPFDNLLNQYKVFLAESKKSEQLKAFELLKDTWPSLVSGWDADKTDIQQTELELEFEAAVEAGDSIEKEMLSFQLEVIRDHKNGLNGIAIEADLRRAQQQLDAARQKELTESETEKSKERQLEVIRLREIETKMRSEESERHNVMQKQIETGSLKLRTWITNYDAWTTLPPLDGSRRTTLVNLQQELHDLQWEIQDSIELLDQASLSIQASSTVDYPDVENVLKDIVDAEQDFVRHRNIEREVLLQQWIDVHRYRQNVGYLEIEPEQFWTNVFFEWQHVPFILELKFHNIKAGIRDISEIIATMKNVFQWSLLFALWFWIGRRVEKVWHWLTQWIERQDQPNFFGEFGVNTMLRDATLNESRVVSSLSPYIFHVVVSLFLVSRLQGRPSVTVAYGILLIVSLRLCRPLVDYWIDDKNIETSLVNGLYGFVFGLFGVNVVASVFEHVLHTFQTIQLLFVLQFGMLGLLVIVQLGVWSEFLQGKANETIGLIAIKDWMLQWSTGWIGKRIRAGFAIAIVLWDFLVRVLFWLVEHSSLFGSVLARNAIDEDVSKIKYPKLNTEGWNLEWNILLQPCVELIVDSLHKEEYLGAVCLVADEGMGKSAVLKEVLKLHDEQTHLLTVRHIIRDDDWTSETLMFWLCDELKLTRCSTLDSVCAEIKKMPSSIIGIDDVQRVFLRDVQGFEVINQLFSIIQSTSNRHRWILTCHLATWSFWEAPSTPIRVDFFKTVHKIKPLSVSNIRTAMIQMCSNNDVSLDFSMLSAIDNPQATYRAEMAYWRLLVDSTRGNPSTAMKVFCDSLVQIPLGDSPEASGVGVEMFSLKQPEVLNALDEGAGFILACILLHNRCTLEEIVHSLDMQGDNVLSICRMLVSENICTISDGRYQIDQVWYPWIQANLSQKRFIGQKG